MWLKGGKNGRTLIKKYKGGTLVTIKGYTNNPELRKKEVIPGTFDAVFKAVLTEEKEVLAEIIELVIGIPKEEVIKKDQEFLGLFFYFSQICYDER